MAYHKLEFEDGFYSLPRGFNQGVTFGEDKLYFFGGFNGVDYLDTLTIFNLRNNE